MTLILWLVLPVVLSALTICSRHRAAPERARPAPRELIRRALAVLPSSDDSQAVQRAIDRVLATDPRVDVMVVGPAASQLRTVTPRVTVLGHLASCDQTEALRAGAARALASDYDAVIEVSVEHSRLARRITPLLDALDDGAHVAVGSRYVPGGRVIGCSHPRRWASRSANAALRWVTGLPVNDVTAQIRAYRRPAVEDALMRADGTERTLGLDIMWRCWHAGLRMREVPVTAAGPMCGHVTPAEGRQLLARVVSWRRPPALDGPPVERLLDVTEPVAL